MRQTIKLVSKMFGRNRDANIIEEVREAIRRAWAGELKVAVQPGPHGIDALTVESELGIKIVVGTRAYGRVIGRQTT